ncbi:MAG: hypothetical protein ACI9SP_002495 [Arenicella sp.]|jgi:hypothetical protein
MALMKRKLILHIGYGKTGSSALQSWFANNQEGLMRLGVCYAGGNRAARHYEVSSGNASILLSYLDGEGVADIELIDHYFSDKRTALISAEALQTLGTSDKDRASKLLQFVGNNDIDLQVVAYIRNIYNHNYSNYVQAVKRRGLTGCFDEWFAIEGNANPLRFYLELYQLIPIDLLHYEQEDGHLASAFCKLTNLDYASLTAMENRRVNRTLTHAEIEILIHYIEIAKQVGYKPDVFARHISDHLVNNYPEIRSEVFLSKAVVGQIERQFRSKIDHFNLISRKNFDFELKVLNKSGYVDGESMSGRSRLEAKSRVQSSIIRQLDVLSDGPRFNFVLKLSFKEPIYVLKMLLRYTLKKLLVFVMRVLSRLERML